MMNRVAAIACDVSRWRHAPVLKVEDSLTLLLVALLVLGHGEAVATRELAHHPCRNRQPYNHDVITAVF